MATGLTALGYDRDGEPRPDGVSEGLDRTRERMPDPEDDQEEASAISNFFWGRVIDVGLAVFVVVVTIVAHARTVVVVAIIAIIAGVTSPWLPMLVAAVSIVLQLIWSEGVIAPLAQRTGVEV